MTRILGALLFLFVAATNAAGQAVDQLGKYRFPVTVQGHALNIPFDGNQSLTSSLPNVRRAVILIHGSARHSDTALETSIENAKSAGVNDATTLLVDPQFLTEEDIDAHNLASDMLFWEDDGWKQGDPSLSTSRNPRPAKISSFAVLDAMLLRIASLCPHLETIVIGGHSAGGQFTNRFAAGSLVPQTLAQQSGIQMSYIVANPSSYLYMDGTRLVPGTTDTWAIPRTSCSDYNSYKYGLQSRSPYMAAVPDQQIINQYAQRRVTYLLGGADVDPNGDGVDTDCPAEIQGRFRLERGLTYLKYLKHFYGPGIADRHQAIVVAGVGHDSRGMFTSAGGRNAMFGGGSVTPPPPPPTNPGAILTPGLTLRDPAMSNQNDMCIWIHPSDRSLSTIIASDQTAKKLFVYDLSGHTLQVVPTSGQPGNVDVRYGFVLGGVPTDLVAFNDRTNKKIKVFKVDRTTRLLTRVDNDAIATGSSYGFTLYRSATSGLYYAFTTSTKGAIKQFQLSDQGGKVAGTQVRSWSVGSTTEGCAADDANATVFFSQESKGVWKVGAEPGASTPGSLIAKVNDSSGLAADVEGIAVYRGAGNAGYLLVSSQGSSEFKVYDLLAPNHYVKTFTIDGVTGASGIDVTSANLGAAFPNGIFVAQNGSSSRKPVAVCGFAAGGLLASAIAPVPSANAEPAPGETGGTGRPERTGRILELTTYPNPFTTDAQVRYRLASAQRVEVDVLDVAGRVVATLASGEQAAGVHQVSWNARSSRGQRLPTGLYLVRIRNASETLTHKVIVSK